jgi:hypothetical protein
MHIIQAVRLARSVNDSGGKRVFLYVDEATNW